MLIVDVLLKDEIIKKSLQILKKHGAKTVEIFGSYVRGEASFESDLDIIVDFEERKSLLELVGIEQELEDYLGIKVDLLTESYISHYLIERIKRIQSNSMMIKDDTVFLRHIRCYIFN